MSGLLDKMQATPRSKGWGLLADALTAANDYAQKPDRSMPMFGTAHRTSSTSSTAARSARARVRRLMGMGCIWLRTRR